MIKPGCHEGIGIDDNLEQKNMMDKHRLILVRGLGGTGKTTVSSNLSKLLRAPIINRDDVKPIIRNIIKDESTITEVSYAVMNTLANIQLRNGVSVIVDATARFQSMENFYLKMCEDHGADLYIITCICSDQKTWKKRIVDRGSVHPLSFEETRDMYIENFNSSRQISIDTTKLTEKEAAHKCLEFLGITGLRR